MLQLDFLPWHGAVYQSNKIPPPYVKIYEPPCSEAFKVLLVQHMEAEKPLPSSVAFHWIFLHLKDELVHPSLPPKFLQDLQSLFTCRYLQNFRRGLIVTPNSFPLKIEYEASQSNYHRKYHLLDSKSFRPCTFHKFSSSPSLTF